MSAVRVHDRRRVPFFMVGKPDLARLAEVAEPRALPYARSVYFALLELANDQRADEISAARSEVATRAGVSAATLKRCVPMLVEAGLIRVREVAGHPNVWTLLSADEGGSDRAGSEGEGGSDRAGGRLHESRGAALVEPGLKETGQEKGTNEENTSFFSGRSPGKNDRGVLAVPDVAVDPSMLEDADALLKNKRKVDGKLVTEAEMLRAAAALSEFNRLMDADFGLGANLTAIVMRVRDRPSWDAAKHARLVQSACRIKWWRKKGSQRRATPAVIYGNPQVFEQVAQDARDEAAGRELVEDTDLRNHLYNGVPWDQLTRAQQENAREALTMGIKPWERRPDPVPLPRNGSVQSFTADNFAAA